VGVVCVGRDVIVWQLYWIVLRRRCHTVHQMSAGPVDSIHKFIDLPLQVIISYLGQMVFGFCHGPRCEKANIYGLPVVRQNTYC